MVGHRASRETQAPHDLGFRSDRAERLLKRGNESLYDRYHVFFERAGIRDRSGVARRRPIKGAKSEMSWSAIRGDKNAVRICFRVGFDPACASISVRRFLLIGSERRAITASIRLSLDWKW